jgi:hypothetical protein
VKDRTKEAQPSPVPETAQQGGEIRARWAWVEPTVWTERMLATLETGIEGGKWEAPKGAVLSPLLSNIYRNGLDWKMARNGFEMVRYATIRAKIIFPC